MKGSSVLMASVILVLITVVASIFLSGWMSTTTSAQTSRIRNNTETQLKCQFADIYIKNVTYDCNSDCASGVAHTLSLNIVNSGKKEVVISTIYVRNITGFVTAFRLNESKILNVGDVISVQNVTSSSCTGINNTIELVSVNTITCPATAYDSIQGDEVTYTNC